MKRSKLASKTSDAELYNIKNFMNEDKLSASRKVAKKGLHKLKREGHLETTSTDHSSKPKKPVRTKTYSKGNTKAHFTTKNAANQYIRY